MNLSKNILYSTSIFILTIILVFLTPFLNFTEKFLSNVILILNSGGESLTNFLKVQHSSTETHQMSDDEIKYKRLLFEMENENILLKRQLGLIENLTRNVVSANQIFDIVTVSIFLKIDSSPWHESVSIDAGEDVNIKPGFFVVNGNVLVGKVKKTYKKWSIIELITDESFKLSVYIQSSKNGLSTNFKQERIGLLRGTSKGYCTIDWISISEDVQEGDVVFTYGNNKLLCPDGLIVGKVTHVSRSKAGYKYHVKLNPRFKTDSLDVVFVLKSKK